MNIVIVDRITVDWFLFINQFLILFGSGSATLYQKLDEAFAYVTTPPDAVVLDYDFGMGPNRVNEVRAMWPATKIVGHIRGDASQAEAFRSVGVESIIDTAMTFQKMANVIRS